MCGKGEPGAIGAVDPNYHFKTTSISIEDLHEIIKEMQKEE